VNAVSSTSVSSLREGVQEAYSRAAEHPREDHPFPVGRNFAENVGYPANLLRRLPAVSVQVFAGVSNLSILAEIPQGTTVLDLGCGGGLDSIIAARRTGTQGQVFGVDFSPAMLKCAKQGLLEAGVNNVRVYSADAERLPIEDNSVDVALANGIFNLNPQRSRIFSELARVVKPGGSVYAAELILREAPAEEVQATATNWFA